MKGKSLVSGERYLAGGLQSVWCGATRPGWQGRTVQWKGVLARHRKEFNALLSVSIIGGIFLLGIWGFLVQLAEC